MKFTSRLRRSSLATARDRIALLFGKPRDGFTLCFEAQAAATLACGANADVADDRFCHECPLDVTSRRT